MQVQIDCADDLKRMFDAIKEIVKEVNLCIDENGICCSAMDSSHVAFVKMTITSMACRSFQASGNHVIGLKTPTLCKFLSSCDMRDSVQLIYDTGNQDVLGLKFTSNDMKRYSNFKMKLMQIDSEELQIPDIDFGVTITMPFVSLNKIIKDLSLVGDVVEIAVNEEGVTFAIPKSSDLGEGGTTLVDSDTVTIQRNQGILKMAFSLKYFQLFTKTQLTQGDVIIGLADNIPLMLQMQVGNTGTMSFYMAPKIDD